MKDPDEIGTGRDKSGVAGYFLNLGMAFAQVLAAFSSLFTAIVTGAHYRVTFSAQSGRWLEQGKKRGKLFVPIINRLFEKFLKEKEHCQRSWNFRREVLRFERSLKSILNPLK